jgi:hypothetical protein
MPGFMSCAEVEADGRCAFSELFIFSRSQLQRRGQDGNSGGGAKAFSLPRCVLLR